MSCRWTRDGAGEGVVDGRGGGGIQKPPCLPTMKLA